MTKTPRNMKTSSRIDPRGKLVDVDPRRIGPDPQRMGPEEYEAWTTRTVEHLGPGQGPRHRLRQIPIGADAGHLA